MQIVSETELWAGQNNVQTDRQTNGLSNFYTPSSPTHISDPKHKNRNKINPKIQ